MNVTLKPELTKFVQDKVDAGEYASAEELLEAAVARLIFDPKCEQLDEQSLAAMEEGESQLDRGQAIPVEEAFHQLRQKYAAK